MLKNRGGELMEAIQEFKPEYDRQFVEILYPIKSDFDKFMEAKGFHKDPTKMFKVVSGKVVLNNPYKLKKKKTGVSSWKDLASKLGSTGTEANADSGIGSRLKIINKDYRHLLGDSVSSQKDFEKKIRKKMARI